MPRQAVTNRARPATLQNLVLYSEQFNNAAWIKEGTVSVTANQVANPTDGTVNADLFVNVSNTQGIYQRSITVPLGATYTRSVWLRCASGTMNVRAAGYFGTEFSATWAVTTTWQRFTASGTKTTGTTEVGFYLFNSDVGTLTNLYAWGAQITIANWEGPYATTTAAAVNTGNLRNRPATLQNLLLYSEQANNGAYTGINVTITANTTTAPDGTATADTVTASGGGAVEHTTRQVTSPVVAGIVTGSCYVKYNNCQWVSLGSRNGTVEKRAWFDIQNGVKGTVNSGVTSTIESIGNGWYRISASWLSGTSLGGSSDHCLAPVTGDGVSDVYTQAGQAVYVWGAQLVSANWAGPYALTTSAAVNTGNIRNRVSNRQTI